MKHFAKKRNGSWWVCYGTSTAYKELYRIFHESVPEAAVKRAIARRHGDSKAKL